MSCWSRCCKAFVVVQNPRLLSKQNSDPSQPQALFQLALAETVKEPEALRPFERAKNFPEPPPTVDGFVFWA